MYFIVTIGCLKNKNNSQIFGNVPRNSIVEYKIEKIINDRIELHKNKLNKIFMDNAKYSLLNFKIFSCM